jgi:hypothetical protein
MLTGNLLNQCKQRMLRVLADYTGLEQREQQLVSDLQLLNPSLKPDDVRQTLGALKDDGYAARRVDDLRGALWKVTPEGAKAAAGLALDDGE